MNMKILRSAARALLSVPFFCSSPAGVIAILMGAMMVPALSAEKKKGVGALPKDGFQGVFVPPPFDTNHEQVDTVFLSKEKKDFAPAKAADFDAERFVQAVSEESDFLNYAERLQALMRRFTGIVLLGKKSPNPKEAMFVLLLPQQPVNYQVKNADVPTTLKLRSFMPGPLKTLAELKNTFGDSSESEKWEGYQEFGVKDTIHWWGSVGVGTREDGKISHLAVRRTPSAAKDEPAAESGIRPAWTTDPMLFIKEVQRVMDERGLPPEKAVPKFIAEQYFSGLSTEVEWVGDVHPGSRSKGTIEIDIHTPDLIHDATRFKTNLLALSPTQEERKVWGGYFKGLPPTGKNWPQAVFRTTMLPMVGVVFDSCVGDGRPPILGIDWRDDGSLSGMMSREMCSAKGKHRHVSHTTQGAVFVSKKDAATKEQVNPASK